MKIGNALVAPIVPFVPEGDIDQVIKALRSSVIKGRKGAGDNLIP